MNSKKMPLENAFMLRTLSIFSSQVKRFAERRYKTGKRAGMVSRVGRTVPYNLLQFRAWVVQVLDGEQGMTYCTYCREPLDAMNIEFDHKQPITQGGSLELENLVPCCEACNRLKGELQAETFVWLLKVLSLGGTAGPPPFSMSIADANDIRKRLKGGAGFIFKKFPPKPGIQKEVASTLQPVHTLQEADEDF